MEVEVLTRIVSSTSVVLQRKRNAGNTVIDAKAEKMDMQKIHK